SVGVSPPSDRKEMTPIPRPAKTTATSRNGQTELHPLRGSRWTPTGAPSGPRTSNSSGGYGYWLFVTPDRVAVPRPGTYSRCSASRLRRSAVRPVESPGGARPLARGPHPAQPLHEHRVVLERGRGVDQGVEHLVVPRGRHVEELAHGLLL